LATVAIGAVNPTFAMISEEQEPIGKRALSNISVGKAFGHVPEVRHAPCYMMCTQKDDYYNTIVKAHVYEPVFQVKHQKSAKGSLADPIIGSLEVQYRFRPEGKSEVFIQGIMIEEPYRRQRFGIETLLTCLGIYRNSEQLPFDTFSLLVNRQNSIAIHLFEIFGFKMDPSKSDDIFLNMSRPRTLNLKNRSVYEVD